MADNKYPPITFEYIKSQDYKVHHVHGGVGGPNAYGELVLNLYFERGAIPKRATHKINNDGVLESEPIKVEQKDAMIRDVLFALSLTPSHAKSVGTWLIQNAEKLESQMLPIIETEKK